MKRNDVDRHLLSPMMQQYMEIKDQYSDELLFFRLGDFYELFFEDGIIASKELELTLTGKNAGLAERVPMCGVPYHSVKPYIEKLVNKGYKVAICEQLEDPKNTKGMVKRGVVNVISKGTIIDAEMLKDYEQNYIASLLDFNFCYVLTYSDISTGHMYIKEIEYKEETVLNEILNLNIKELVLLNDNNSNLINTLKNVYNIEISLSNEYLNNGYEELINTVRDIKYQTGVRHLLYYIVIKQLKDVSHINEVKVISEHAYLEMNVHTRRNLELTETLRLKERTFSLIWLLDKTKTAMGSRKLKDWMLEPLIDKDKINQRYDSIELINTEFILKEELRIALDEVYDLERLCGKVNCGSVNARDVLQIKRSIAAFPTILKNAKSIGLVFNITLQDELLDILERGIYENPPITLKDGYLIKDGYNVELDELKTIRSGGKEFISNLEESERNATGIKSLKVGYTKVFGYYIEVSKGQIGAIKPEFGWERRQTLTSCERYISPQLKEKEALILNAEERIIELEYKLFLEIKDEIKKHLYELQDAANKIAELDALISLASCAEELNLVRPTITDEKCVEIIGGRHPVVEKVNKDSYVANDCIMKPGINTLLITGPNMSGKSTYMRQLAIIIIMAQMGSFVPAKSAKLPIFDKIFTRIGASDDLVSGESTFMVEMKEAEYAINNATENSLILFDELGRGTATYDGMSLAQAILEYISKEVKCKTLFSTHYHELTSLEHEISGVKNVHVSAIEDQGTITFLHKVKNGAVDKSYGIHVAKLANLPDEIIKRADKILALYENEGKKTKEIVGEQCSFDFDELPNNNEIIERLKSVDPMKITPIEAINILYELKQMEK